MTTKTATKTATKVEITDLMDHEELLFLFLKYVEQCVEDNSIRNTMRPMSFDEWYNLKYLPNIETLTQIVSLNIDYNMSGVYGKETVECRVPSETVGENNGGVFQIETLRRVAEKLDRKKYYSETLITYRDQIFYRWSADI